MCWKRHLMEEINVAVLAPNRRWDVAQTVLEKGAAGRVFLREHQIV